MKFEAIDKRLWLKVLSVGCSLGSPLAGCPLAEVRELELAERLSAVDDMTDQRVDTVIGHHLRCFSDRGEG